MYPIFDTIQLDGRHLSKIPVHPDPYIQLRPPHATAELCFLCLLCCAYYGLREEISSLDIPRRFRKFGVDLTRCQAYWLVRRPQ